ncbi:hypothetical protein CFP65_3965 [Kitasatospora sp. MMS16-BH015]|uniref:hypothetical protein n=1 Tax=Kitasatospora sp. MMS16-BH015 TaxID=2018025 RepID=UPI000CA25E69|nr:hypothetical protein [Kitasatospora sp. MMS16-BH015]AUG78735.1 hypothetical protein CFP65_3965 [Kitasatospora sp. MMS16-BH015]
MKTTLPRRAAALALLAAATLTACGSTTTTPARSGPTAPAASVPGVTTPSTPAQPLVLDEHANGTTVHLAVDATLHLDLHSTYWSRPVSSAPALLAAVTVATPGTDLPNCHPGSGCGTVVGGFTAKAPGTAQITAHRTSCGEAKPCAPDQQTFTLTVDIP